ncbi:MAG: putative rane protein [Glaciihabitans sp.]|nr:putative rane protein [Glaciihabitans sp.]
MLHESVGSQDGACTYASGMDDTTTIVYENGWWWFALALVNAGLAESKGRRRSIWFVLSLFLGPLATALIVVWPRPKKTPPSP